jgi:hypothetical protein
LDGPFAKLVAAATFSGAFAPRTPGGHNTIGGARLCVARKALLKFRARSAIKGVLEQNGTSAGLHTSTAISRAFAVRGPGTDLAMHNACERIANFGLLEMGALVTLAHGSRSDGTSTGLHTTTTLSITLTPCGPITNAAMDRAIFNQAFLGLFQLRAVVATVLGLGHDSTRPGAGSDTAGYRARRPCGPSRHLAVSWGCRGGGCWWGGWGESITDEDSGVTANFASHLAAQCHSWLDDRNAIESVLALVTKTRVAAKVTALTWELVSICSSSDG